MGRGATVSLSIPQIDIGGTRADVAPGIASQQWFDHDGRLIASGGRAGDRWWMHWAGLATFWFGDSGPVVAHPAAPGLLPHIRDAFARGVIPVVLIARGFEALHASAVVHDEGVIGFCATSGTGKSTLALALGAAGLRHFADDTIVYRVGGSRPVAVALTAPPRVDAMAHQAVSRLWNTKPEQTTPLTTAPIHRIYNLIRDPTVMPRSPLFSELSAADAFERLLGHAHPFEMGSDERRRAFIESLLSLGRDVPVWDVRFAPALEDLPALASCIRNHASRS